jgi:hypothetical protein
MIRLRKMQNAKEVEEKYKAAIAKADQAFTGKRLCFCKSSY